MSIELIVLDVDGTMTDSRITYSENGDEIKSFNVKDGLAIASWRRLGKKVAIITGRSSQIVARRAKELHIEHFYQGIHNKKEVLDSLLKKLDLTMENVAAIGDDLNDLQMLRAAKISFVPRDASAYVDKIATVVLSKRGGDGAVREMIEHLIVKEGLEKEVFGSMGLKLAVVLIVAIVGIILGTLMVKFDDTSAEEQTFTKEVEFTNTTFIEVDTDMMKSRAFAKYGVREKGIWTLDDLVFASDTIESLHANKGSYHDDILYVDGDVVMQEKNGYKYETQHAIYNQKTEILNITAPFTGVKDKNIISGKSLEYDTRQKKAHGTTVGTVFYTPDK